ncbi:MAG: restriction endonuclease subunit S [Truepera sp.]|nr:restriction endonuclease subunit S [Truepera sp.]
MRFRYQSPPLPEQTAITHFLDYTDRRIQRYIRAKQKLITLLEEQKQAIIHQAVTGQIDVRTGQPYPAYKDSGVEWLGEVPEHWDLRPAKRHFWEVDERSETGSEELMSVSHITGVTPRSEKKVTMFTAVSNVGHKLCRPGDLVINTMWAWMAALGVARQAGIVSPSYSVYRPYRLSELLGEYTDLLLRTDSYKSEYTRRSTGIRSSRLRMYPEEFLRIKLLCPPPEEQRAIVEVVGKGTGSAMTDSNSAISHTQRQIDLLSEYRTRLISDVVTGKLDVREAAARLPEVDPLETEADLETLDPTTELTEELGALAEGAPA